MREAACYTFTCSNRTVPKQLNGQMNYGSGWVVIEQYFHSGERRLVSILPPRTNKSEVARYVGQAYVDTHASVREKLTYKKGNEQLPAYAVSENAFDSVMHCGHEPFFVCFYSQKITLNKDLVKFQYKICVNHDDLLAPRYEVRTQSIGAEV